VKDLLSDFDRSIVVAKNVYDEKVEQDGEANALFEKAAW
jgi:hypothetical protein